MAESGAHSPLEQFEIKNILSGAHGEIGTFTFTNSSLMMVAALVLISAFLILSRQFPRSIRFCYGGIRFHLDRLTQQYGDYPACNETVTDMLERLVDKDVGEIFRTGLHEFVEHAIATTNRLSDEISDAYHF